MVDNKNQPCFNGVNKLIVCMFTACVNDSNTENPLVRAVNSCFRVFLFSGVIMITQKYLKTILHYDSKTGHFTWLKELGRRGKVGTVAGNVNKCGYHVIGINRKTYTAHRLAYLYVNNSCPKILDHINRIKTDNRIENIRPASSSNNQNNTSLSKANTSGYKGVAFSPRGKPWTAKIGKDGKQIYLGAFNTPEEAHAAYCEKGKEINGEFFCEG